MIEMNVIRVIGEPGFSAINRDFEGGMDIFENMCPRIKCACS